MSTPYRASAKPPVEFFPIIPITNDMELANGTHLDALGAMLGISRGTHRGSPMSNHRYRVALEDALEGQGR